MRKVVIAASVVAVVLGGCATWPGRVKLPHRSLPYAEACPGFQDVRCHPDDDPRGLIYNLTPPPLARPNGVPAYGDLIGRAYRQPYQRGDIGRPCGASTSPFDSSHFDTTAAESSFEYSYRLNSTLNAGANADLVAAARAAGLPPAAADRLQAAARAAFNRARNREVSTTGRMHVVRLKTATIDELRLGSDPAFAACRQFLAQNTNYALMKAATVFHIERSASDTQIAEQIVADIKTNVTGLTDQQLATIEADVARVVGEQIRSALADRYIVWAATWLRPEDA